MRFILIISCNYKSSQINIMKRKLIFILSILTTAYIIVFAGGGGNKNNGGSGSGGSVPVPNWMNTTLYETWVYAKTPVNTTCGNYFLMSFGSNTCSTITSQTIYNASNNYYCKIVVQSLETTTETRTFCRSLVGSGTTIQIPYNHKYKITYEFLEKCSNCVSPNLVSLANGQGKRIFWNVIRSYNRYTVSPQIQPTYNGLANCQ